jgi:hypothetical protein
MPVERYHLTLAAGGRAVLQGWWADRAVADRKFLGWVGEYGNFPGARITLVDEEAGETLTTWPEES